MQWSWEALSLVVMDWRCFWCVCWRPVVMGVGGIVVGIGGNRGVGIVLTLEVMECGGMCDGLWFFLVVARRWWRRYFGSLAVMEVLRAAAELQFFCAARVT